MEKFSYGDANRHFWQEIISALNLNSGRLGLGELCPFCKGVEIESLNIDNYLPPDGTDLSREELVLSELNILGSCKIDLKLLRLDLSGTCIGGDLVLGGAYRVLDLTGVVFNGVLDLTLLKCEAIWCLPRQAPRIHLAAPTIPLVFEGM